MNPKEEFAPWKMPTQDYNSDVWARRAITSLNSFHFVDIHWESEVGSDGEEHGQWTVQLEHGVKSVRTKHSSILNAIWSALQQMEHEIDEESRKVEFEKKAALAKLTDRERQILRL